MTGEVIFSLFTSSSTLIIYNFSLLIDSKPNDLLSMLSVQCSMFNDQCSMLNDPALMDGTGEMVAALKRPRPPV
jgi:hypothetical protein